ncbi:DUF4479 domain-containing protein [Lactobacillus sp. S2-2]|uniref:YtpR family tRNA-binding protein n=1 Tax=Lactobacillus sp. S2-2 TaxID=2692917 RepID=UPI001F2E6483|nr:DUF4479 domain-containing protein [Lactobacillus sp. S2-2]MCF6515158.1 DUF4479 domain-containing protein [Lactobacillus sp. S2-2]
MLIASYNPNQIGDVLILITGQGSKNQNIEMKNNWVEIKDNDEVVGFNLFNASKLIPEIAEMNGKIDLSEDMIKTLNSDLLKSGFDYQFEISNESEFVVGFVNSIKEHPKSDHLKITETIIDNDKKLQIVSGSPNMQEKIKVVVAKVGAMMPDGLVIWPGELKGEKSDGMIASGRELRIPNAPNKPGALILPDEYEIGQEFDFEKAQNLFSE